ATGVGAVGRPAGEAAACHALGADSFAGAGAGAVGRPAGGAAALVDPSFAGPEEVAAGVTVAFTESGSPVRRSRCARWRAAAEADCAAPDSEARATPGHSAASSATSATATAHPLHNPRFKPE
ncbi:MAG: hypothetical protein AB1758_09725, partial [Candidatus Eremiobacterota bacterium]